jgi:Zn-dependent protease/CBS domain-containing protein
MPYLPVSARTQVRGEGPGPYQRLRGIHIARLFGIDLAIDPSWFIIIVLVVLSIESQFNLLFGSVIAPPVLWLAALVEGILFFTSVLIHELSHSLVARGQGVGVRSITLFLFGGVSELTNEPARATDEFLIAAVGPLSSLVLGGFFGILSTALPQGSFPRYFFYWLSFVNILLACFNLLPGFPLDGGRVLRSLIWRATGSLRRATRVATFTGSLIAYGLIVLGIYLFLFRGAVFNGIWFAFIGWFLLNAAQSSLADQRSREILSHHRVSQVLETDCPQVPSEETLATFVDRYLLRSGERCFFVTEEGTLTGLITLRDIGAIPRTHWHETMVRDIMVPFNRIRHLSPSDSLLTAMDVMGRNGINQLPVMDEGRFEGIVTREGLLRAIALDLELDQSTEHRPPPGN